MLTLLDYRRQVSDLYRVLREEGDDPQVCAWFRHQRDELFRTHQQSPLDAEQKQTFGGLPYYAYDPAFRVVARVNMNITPQSFRVELGDDGVLEYWRFGKVSFELPTGGGTLSLFWLSGYGGGVFLPFGDATNKATSYGGGRYLYDSIKGADLGATASEIVLDFNYAYHPSCAYNVRWVCPLTPAENKLDFPVHAGEQLIQQ